MRAFTQRTTRTLALTGVVAGATLLLAACGGTDSTGGAERGGSSASATATSGASADATASGAFNDADVLFAQSMIPHHEQALEMARLADGRAEDAGIKKIVAAVEAAQDPEIRKMKGWLKGWGKPETAGSGSASGTDHGSGSASGHGSDHGSGTGSGSGGGHSMAGMMSEQDMKALSAAKGRDFDRTFAELMIAHHEGAVTMAQEERKKGRNEAAKALADDVVRTQTAEIAELRKILDRL